MSEKNIMFERVAEFALSTVTEIPDGALDMAAILLLDTLGVAAGGSNLDAGRIARDYAVEFQAAGQPQNAARVLFDDRRASIAGAAFAGATQIDNLDGHDGYNPTKGHIGCAVVPALMAFAEAFPDISGREALKALVISYEVAARAGISLHASVSDYHTSGAWNGLGVVALGSRLRGNSPDEFRHALGIAEYHGPRSQMMREIANPTMLHDGSGMGALTGTMAVLFAEKGFEGAPAITLEAPEAAQHWQDLGQYWTIEQNYIKPYPVCRWAHAAIDAARALRKAHNVHPDEIESLEIRTFTEASRLFPGMPSSTSQAQYSLSFAVSAMMVHGAISAENIQGAGLNDATVAQFLDKITVVEDARHSDRFPEGRWSDVVINLSSGERLESGDVHARGGPENPMEARELQQKFNNMTKGVLNPEESERIWQTGKALTSNTSVFRDFANLLYKT